MLLCILIASLLDISGTVDDPISKVERCGINTYIGGIESRGEGVMNIERSLNYMTATGNAQGLN